MTRSTFGGTSDDILIGTGPDGALRYTSGTLTFWDAQTGGSQLVGLILNGSATAAIPVGANGQVPTFQGPDGVTQMWADAGGDAERTLMLPAVLTVVVPVGATGYATQPDGTLWVEYTP